MKYQKGFTIIELLIISIILLLIIMLPILVHQNVSRKQAVMAKAGVEMSYWDVFWTDPVLVYNQGEIAIINKEGE